MLIGTTSKQDNSNYRHKDPSAIAYPAWINLRWIHSIIKKCYWLTTCNFYSTNINNNVCKITFVFYSFLTLSNHRWIFCHKNLFFPWSAKKLWKNFPVFFTFRNGKLSKIAHFWGKFFKISIFEEKLSKFSLFWG